MTGVNFSYIAVNSCLLGSNIFLSILFSNVINVVTFFMVKDLSLYRTKFKLQFRAF
jgi:hypothetical protein